MTKAYQKLYEWASKRTEDMCSRLSPRTRRLVIFVLFISFAASSLYVFGDAIYQIGKKEGRKDMLKIEYIDSVPLINNDSIKQETSTNLWIRKMKG